MVTPVLGIVFSVFTEVMMSAVGIERQWEAHGPDYTVQRPRWEGPSAGLGPLSAEFVPRQSEGGHGCNIQLLLEH